MSDLAMIWFCRTLAIIATAYLRFKSGPRGQETAFRELDALRKALAEKQQTL